MSHSRLAMALFAALAVTLVLALGANAQTPPDETAVPTGGGATPAGEATPTPEPGQVQETDARVFVVAPENELEEGDTFEAEVQLEGAERIAAFSFGLEFDPSHLQIVDQDPNVDGLQFGRSIGDFLTLGDRENILCDEAKTRPEDKIIAQCVTNDLPVCLGGPMGASGSGTLGIFEFEVTKSGDTELTVAESKLILDDYATCESPVLVESLPTVEGTTVKVKGDSFPWLIVGGIVAVVAALLAGGAFAFARTRSSGSRS